MDLSGIISCSTFSVVPSIINENAKKRTVLLKTLIITVLDFTNKLSFVTLSFDAKTLSHIQLKVLFSP